MLNFTYNIYTVLIEIYILVSIFNLILFGVLYSTSFTKGYPILTNLYYFFSLQITINSVVLLLYYYPLIIKSWYNLISIDLMTYNIKLGILIFFIIYCLIIKSYSNYQNLNTFEFWILLLLSIVAFCLVIQVNDFLLLYLTIEFQSLIFYILASYTRTSEFSAEAGLKYFIIGAFSSALLLFGISLIYGLSGITNFSDFTNLFLSIDIITLNISTGIVVGTIFIIISVLFKLSAAPYHMWAPDVYEGAPSSITALFAILSKIVIVSILTKLLLLVFHDFILYWRYILLVSIVCSSILGTLSAFQQIKLKKFIAYSSISHISFWLLALYTGDILGLNSLIIYLIIYLIMLTMLFIVLLNMQVIKYPVLNQIRYFEGFENLVQLNPLLTLLLTLLLFSMAGIPPMAGFFAKFLVLLAALKSNFYSIVFLLIVFNCIACFYYLRLIKIIYFSKKLKCNVFTTFNQINSILLILGVVCLTLIFLDFELMFIIINLITKLFLV